MSLRANFLGVNLKEVRKFNHSEFENGEIDGIEIETENFINELISFVYHLPNNIQDPNFLSEGLGPVFEHFYKEYTINGRPLFGFEIDSSWSIYAFLTHNELKGFILKIESLPQDYQSKYPLLKYFSEKDKVDTLNWFKEVLNKDKTLWFWTN